MSKDDDDDEDITAWHLDRRVPIALIAAVLLQVAGLVYWGARVDARLGALEHRISVEADDHERLVRVEATVESIDARLARMETRRD